VVAGGSWNDTSQAIALASSLRKIIIFAQKHVSRYTQFHADSNPRLQRQDIAFNDVNESQRRLDAGPQQQGFPWLSDYAGNHIMTQQPPRPIQKPPSPQLLRHQEQFGRPAAVRQTCLQTGTQFPWIGTVACVWQY